MDKVQKHNSFNTKSGIFMLAYLISLQLNEAENLVEMRPAVLKL
jgi:hypothetical protein